MAIDWDKVAARIEELKRNPPTVWRGGPWPDEEEDVPPDYAAGFDDAFERRAKRSDPSPAYEEGWAAHFERVADWKRFMEANGLSLEGYEFSSEWEREYCERNFLTRATTPEGSKPCPNASGWLFRRNDRHARHTTGEFTIGGRNRHAAKPPWRHGRKAVASRSPPCGATPLAHPSAAPPQSCTMRVEPALLSRGPRRGAAFQGATLVPLRRRIRHWCRLSSRETRTCVQASEGARVQALPWVVSLTPQSD